MDIIFESVLERDIDLLIINKFIKGNLLNVFLNRLGINHYDIDSIEHSHMDSELGESDVTVIIKNNDKKIGLLIEDKIDARAMDLQPERYVSRGEKGISQNQYDEFYTFIVAPKKYLDTNPYAKKYQYQISYEELIENISNDLYAETLLKKAIEEKEVGYSVIENEKVTKYWERYYDFIHKYYPMIKMNEIHGPRGAKAVWPELRTDYSQVQIIHKSDRGYMDMTFSKMGDNIELFDKFVKNLEENLNVVKTGKSLAIRLNVPIIDFKNDFDNDIEKMHECMKSVLKLYEVLSKMNVLMMYQELEKGD